jgi:hypothetical protein
MNVSEEEEKKKTKTNCSVAKNTQQRKSKQIVNVNVIRFFSSLSHSILYLTTFSISFVCIIKSLLDLK